MSQRLSLAGWPPEVDKMVRWGAVTTGVTPGAPLYNRACLSCHGADLVDQQRLSRTEWVREVQRMVRWGATVGETEKDALADHLAGQVGVR